METAHIAILLVALIIFILFISPKSSEMSSEIESQIIEGLWEANIPFLKEANLKVFTVYFNKTPATKGKNRWMAHFFVEDKNGQVILNKQTNATLSKNKIHLDDDLTIFPQNMKVEYKNNHMSFLNKDETIADLEKFCQK